MNRKFTFLLTLTLLILLPSFVFAFDDISGHWAENVITKYSESQIISGYGDNTFKPDNYMTRAELATVLKKTLGLQSESDKYIPDVASIDWYNSDIRSAVYFGIMHGDETGYIRPNEYVTREQAILMFTRAFCIQTDKTLTCSYKDLNDVSDWAYEAVITFSRLSYINGYEDNTIRPQSNITRAEIITILDKILNNVITDGSYSKHLRGNVFIEKKNISLKNVDIKGNLYISEKAASTVYLSNVAVDGNLILYAPVDLEGNTILVKDTIVKVYDNNVVSDKYYDDEVYGIRFPIPQNTSLVKASETTTGTYDKDNIIIIESMQNDNYYFTNFQDVCNSVLRSMKYDSIYMLELSGKIHNYEYALYNDNAKSSVLIIKRDNIVYKLLFVNVANNNLIDNIISNISFYNGTNVVTHDEKIYKNSKLCLKFRYNDGYIGVDDSYNTGVVYSGDAFFKLFIQVNMITDIDDYSTNEIMALLETLAVNDGDILEKKITKVMNYDAISFEIESGNDKIVSLYVIIGNNLYNFIFKGEKTKFDSVGKDIFTQMISTIEF